MAASAIHSVAFEESLWTPTTARAWLKKHYLKPVKKMRRTKNTMRYRIIDPKKFKAFITKKERNGINLIIGFYR